MKLRTPISLYTLIINRSQHKELRLITPTPSKNFTYMSGHLWNTCQKVKGLAMQDLTTTTISSFKHNLKKSLLAAQKMFDPTEWCDLEFTTFSDI